MPNIPAFSSDFALLDVKKGRAELERLVAKGYRIPITIRGFIQPGHQGVGTDDGVSREFSCDVTNVQVGKAEYVPLDKVGRPWATFPQVDVGTKLVFDGDFTCGMANEQRTVKADADGKLYVLCKKGGKGRHYLDGQYEERNGVGFYMGCYLAK